MFPKTTFAPAQKMNGPVRSTRRKIVAGGIWLLIFAAQLQGYDRDWPFPVSPSGEPNFTLLLARIPGALFLKRISLQSALVFDGLRYTSRIIIPELESYLVPVGLGRYEWRTVDGTVIQLKYNSTTAGASREWRMLRQENGVIRIAAVDGTEHYDYKSCRLEAFVVRNEMYQITADSEGDHQIALKNTSGEKQTIICVFQITETKTMVVIAGRRLLLEYGENFELRKVFNEQAANSVCTFGYKDGMLAKVETAQVDLAYTWEKGRLAEYYNSPIEMPPHVVCDGTTVYNIRPRQMYVHVDFHELNGPLKGGWVLDRLTKKVHFLKGS
jgi:hypothetical protein